MKIENLGAMIRFPFELLGVILRFVLNNLVSIIIICLTIWFIYWFFSKRIYDKLVLLFKKDNQNKKIEDTGIKMKEVKEIVSWLIFALIFFNLHCSIFFFKFGNYFLINLLLSIFGNFFFLFVLNAMLYNIK